MARSSKHIVVVLAFAVGLAVAGVAAQSTLRPGDPTQARVWVENRSPSEAVPVEIDRFLTTPSVHLSSVDASVILPSRTTRQRWEYRVGSLEAPALDAAGNDGWEAVGIVPSANGAAVLLKRPR